MIDGEEAELRPEVERANLTTKLGVRLTLQCSAVGNPEPFKLRWIKNRKEIASNTQNGKTLAAKKLSKDNIVSYSFWEKKR